MSLPDGVSTCLLTYGPITDTFGTPATSISVTVAADRSIVHETSGRTLFKHPLTVTAPEGGVAQLPVPHTDQAGFRDQQQNALTGWYYTVTLVALFPDGTREEDRKVFQPLVGQSTIDADLLSSTGIVTPGVTAPSGVVSSVAGRTGVVSAQDVADDVGPLLSATLVPDTGWIDSEFAGGDVACSMRRLGQVVYFLVGGDAGGSEIVGVFPTGFKPSSGGAVVIATLNNNDGTLANVQVDSSGKVTSPSPLGNFSLYGSFITDDAFPF